ncbi:MAG: EthD family reductase [Burkholderiaceae bacterium]|jgi:uncharacterized protein (TIGR02118 family)|nr:EthD family reductase [Betaproteobacteria bacterium]MBP6645788.1 EthD family reductase [Burkholderiaceae bacterium]
MSVVRMGLINKPDDWSMARFRAHWRENHAPLAARLPGLREYVQNHVIDSEQRGISFKRGPEHLDGLSQLTFDSLQSMRSAIATEVGPALIEDENLFIGRLRIVTVEPHVVIAPPAPGKTLKRMSLLRRREDVTPEVFAYEWQAVHGPLVRQLPGVLGYRQNLIVGRQSPKGVDVGYEGLPIDGIVELWFSDTDAINAAFGSPIGIETMAHAATFIGEITTFLVDPFTVV